MTARGEEGGKIEKKKEAKGTEEETQGRRGQKREATEVVKTREEMPT